MKRLINTYKLIFIILFLITYLLFFIKYLSNINNQVFLKNIDSDVVVITGGVGRIKTGVDLLKKTKDYRLLISGVGKGVKPSELLLNFKPYIQRIDLGYNASSTMGNALEAKSWAEKRSLEKIILVSNNWHLPRAKLLFKAAMPNVDIRVYPVFSNNKEFKQDKILPKNIIFLFQEHLKYIIAHLQAVLLSSRLTS